MKNLLSAGLFTIAFLSLTSWSTAQTHGSSNKNNAVYSSIRIDSTPNALQPVTNNTENQDSIIKEKLVALAINNPAINVEDAKVKIAEYTLTNAKNSWLGLLSVSSNVNEFVIDNTKINGVAQASYYPKYNVGLTVPLDVFSKTKQAKNIATQGIVVAKEEKNAELRVIRAEVLTRYENYKEKKELARLQKISTEGDNDSYISAQKSYADGTMQLEEMNKTYQSYINSQSKQVSCQRDFNVATIQLEEMIGVLMSQLLSDSTANN